MSLKDLSSFTEGKNSSHQRPARNTGIVSIHGLSYTERAPLYLDSEIEVAALCILKPCANRADGD